MNDGVVDVLKAAGISFELKQHQEPALTSEAAAEQRGVRVSQIVKCMVARSDAGELCALLLPGDRMLKLKKVRKYVGSPLSLVDPKVLAEELGVTVGAISPVQLVGRARLFMDPTVLEEEMVDISSGDPLSGVELASRDLQGFLGAEVADIISNRS
jgi:Cys-tRNA(Pro)/Cys-tRNA(Cys) deacylase